MMVLVYGLLRDDFLRIVKIPTVVKATPLREIRKEARYQDNSYDVRVVGCTQEYLGLANLKMDRGRFLSDYDEERSNNLCVIAAGTAKKLFPYEDPLGKAIQIDDTAYVVVGQTEDRMPSGNVGGSFASLDYNFDVYIPLSTLRWRIGDRVITSRSGSMEGEEVQLSQVTATVDNLDDVDKTADVIRTQLEKFHKFADYEIIVPKELLRQAEVLRLMFKLLLALIAGTRLSSSAASAS